ncbi:MAG: Xaa-Pro aminopeptidase [Rickettsiales bacterium]|nr:Xaa-Pro aminopeptidase [Rickettsiales bacterium]|tara:strand:- start:5305 stop:6618 length:1314 start_codon:yes stop_codon:yes gene_type:complete
MLRLTPEIYARRRQVLAERLPVGAALLVPTAPEVLRSGDSHYPFRPDSDFYYLTGFAEPGSACLLKHSSQGLSFSLFVQARDPEREVWTGRRAGVEGAIERFGADQAFPIEELAEQLHEQLADVESLYFAEHRHPSTSELLKQVREKLSRGRRAELGPSALHDPADLLGELRLHKQPEEIALMREGARITGEAHRLAMEQVRPGMFEYEIEALLHYTFRRNGAWGWAYPSIVGAGENACILHYVENNCAFKEGDLMLIDAGAEIDGYATDVTRTSPVSGRFSAAQRELYEVVLDAQEEAISAVRPGASIDGIHELTVRELCRGLLELGILSGDLEQVMADKSYRRYYMHRTSHWLGLDVHDVGRYHLRDGPSRPLTAGMVLTIEPGLYIAPDDELAPARFRGLGIRIEDDILVTEVGHENLTAAIPKSISDIEALRP